jgi:tRNA A-37 threonylcarbamoyl transferase component Bud32
MTQMVCKACGDPLDPGAAFCPRCGAARGSAGPPADPMIGRVVIGQYVIRERLGEGGMGAVYLADQPSVGRQAVVKVMHPSLSRDPLVAPRFEVEARAASQLNHPHIITIYNYGAMEDDGTLFLAMERVDGPSLEEVLEQGGPVPPQRAVNIALQICDALAEAHRHGVVHRDLKPSNIMLARVGRHDDFVKVLDFGIAKIEGVKMTRTGSVIGTPQYMSPEQLRGSSVDGRSDLYSLGIILYQMVAGQLPFTAETAAGYMHKHLSEDPVAPTRKNPTIRIPSSLDAVILQALAKEPTERFGDADAMGRGLEACREALAGAVSSLPTAPPRTGTKRWVWVAAGGGTAVALAAAATAWVLLRRPPEQPAPPPKEHVAWRHIQENPTEGTGPARVAEALADAGADLQASVDDRPGGKARRGRRGRLVGRVKRGAGDRAKGNGVALAMNRDPGPAAEDPPPRTTPPTRSTPRTAPPQNSGGGQYAKLSATQLEAELRRVVGSAKVPPSSLDKIFEGYKNAMALWPTDQRETMRRRYLVQLITAYQRPSLQLTSFERRPVAQLRKTFMTMQTKANLSAQQREEILNRALASYDTDSFPAKDRPFYKRLALVNMIKNMAADPARAMK